MRTPTVSELLEVQLEQFPCTVQLTLEEMLQWAYPSHQRCIALLTALYKPHGVWYRIPYEMNGRLEEYRGYRFGLKPEDYLSFPA